MLVVHPALEPSHRSPPRCIRRSFTLVETDARRRRCHKNVKALRIGIEKSELAKQKAAAVARAARLTKEQARAARCLAGIRFSSSSDNKTTNNGDDSLRRRLQPLLPIPQVEATNEEVVKSVFGSLSSS